jgi:tRNA(fMet)-specific endonuclease VapC
MIVLDTDHVSILQHADSDVAQRLIDRLSESNEPIATTAITLEEQMRSWLALINRTTDARKQVAFYARFVGTHEFFKDWQLLPFDEQAADHFVLLRQSRLRVATTDLKIAAICLVHSATLLSRNVVDFERVPALISESWL